MDATYFDSPAKLRRWLTKNVGSADEIWVGYYKVGSRIQSVTWPETVDQALCFGWIDGVRKRVDQHRYMIRFTPRKVVSVWSAINIKRVQNLIDLGLMHPAGLKAFAARRQNRSGIYSYEQRLTELPDLYLKQLKRNRAALTFFSAQPGSYRKAAIWWVVSAKHESTRLRRLKQLIADSANQLRIKQFTAMGSKERQLGA